MHQLSKCTCILRLDYPPAFQLGNRVLWPSNSFDPGRLPFGGRLDPFEGVIASLWCNFKMDEKKHFTASLTILPRQKAVGSAFACHSIRCQGFSQQLTWRFSRGYVRI